MRDDLIWLRYAFGAVALTLATIALPMTACEALRAAASRSAPAAETLQAAAALGWLRGDLWGAYAKAEVQEADAATDPVLADSARRAFRRAAEWALSLSPYQPQLWLRLAKLDERDRRPATQFNAVVKMIYYTAPADDAGMADRLQLALSAAGSPDEELDELARGDVRAMVAHHRLTELSAVYRGLGAGARVFIENAVRSIRPELAPQLDAPG
jgi:hypothetical protein